MNCAPMDARMLARPQIEEDPSVLEDEALNGKQTYTAPKRTKTALGASV